MAQCDGINRVECLGFAGSEVICHEAACTDGEAVFETRCDGYGHCQQLPSKKCEPFACGDTACKDWCIDDGDCAAEYRCAAGMCVAGSVCDGDHSITSSGGSTTDCTPYKCADTGTCLGACESTADCVTGHICNAMGQCVPAPQSSSDEGGCQLTPGRKGGAWAWLVVALGLGAGARGVRRRGRTYTARRTFRRGEPAAPVPTAVLCSTTTLLQPLC